VSLNELRSYLRQFIETGLISSYAVPDRLILLDELPRTSVGKINKKALRALICPNSADE